MPARAASTGPLHTIVRFLADLQRGAACHRVAYPAAVIRALRLYAFSQFSRDEIVRYGLFVPAIADAMPVLVSKERSLAALNAINPPQHQSLTEDKDEFHLFCVQHALPVPACVGWRRSGRHFDGYGRPVDGEHAWLEHLAATLPGDFIVKHRAGAYGSGFCAFQHEGAACRRLDTGEVLDWASLTRAFAQVSGGSDYIVQERLFDAAPLVRLCGRQGLQTMRVNTWLEADGGVSVLFYMIKVLAGATIADNFSLGRTGNLIAFGDPDTGVLRGAITVHVCGSGMTTVAMHPDTRVAFDGFAIPGWSDAIDLARSAQRLIPQLPSLGWDLAITGRGPMIIEANARWDPPLYAPFLMAADNWRRVFGRTAGG